MNIELKVIQGANVAVIIGELDGKTAPEAQTVVMQAVTDGIRMILDMTQLSYMSSAGLRMLLIVHRETQARSGKMVLVGVSTDIRDVMNATGFLRFFTLAETFDVGVTLLAS